jgi:glycosyltransferase involved in cell wall biosynthesis
MTIIYSVIIPAFNEEIWLPRTLAALQSAMDAIPLEGEVIVVNNNSTDRTPQIARKYNAHVAFEPVNQISRARNTGARAAKGRFFIFLDADTLVSPALLQAALDYLSSGECGGGGSLVDYDKPLRPMPKDSKPSADSAKRFTPAKEFGFLNDCAHGLNSSRWPSE